MYYRNGERAGGTEMGRLHIQHGADAVRREIELWDEGKVPGHWVRAAMAGCQTCAGWQAARKRLSGMRRSYRRRGA